MVFFFLESFIELICLRISSFDILFLYQIWSLFFWLLFLVVLIFFLIGIIFQWHPLWIGFIFLCQIWLSFFSNLYFFKLFFKFVFSSLFLIIFVSLEFYIVIFLGLSFTLWFGFMICVKSSESWTWLASVIFNYF